MSLNYHQQRLAAGFSIIEAMVAITVLLIAFAGPLSIVGHSLQTALLAQENITAFFLAQEGIELVLERRDSAVLEKITQSTNPADYWKWWPSECYDTPCGLDATGSTPKKCVNNTDCVLHEHSGIDIPKWRLSSSGSSTTTPYTRKITINMCKDDDAHVASDNMCKDDYAHVASEVSWKIKFLNKDKSFTAETYIYNIYGNI